MRLDYDIRGGEEKAASELRVQVGRVGGFFPDEPPVSTGTAFFGLTITSQFDSDVTDHRPSE
jgi:hypothetical protein